MAFGPYSIYYLYSHSTDWDKLGFWGFDITNDGKNIEDDNIIKYPMSESVYNAIVKTLQSLNTVDENTGDLAFKNGWVENDAEKYIELFKELFGNPITEDNPSGTCYVLPYIMPLRIGREPAGGSYIGQQRPVMSEASQIVTDPLHKGQLLPAPADKTWYNNEVADGFDIKIALTHNPNDTETMNAVSEYATVDIQSTDIAALQAFTSKTYVPDNSKLVQFPNMVSGAFTNSTTTLSERYKDISNSEIDELYTSTAYDGTTRWTSGNTSTNDTTGDTQPAFCSGILTADNADDSSYSSSNKRPTIMHRYQGVPGEGEQETEIDKQNEYFFIIRTNRSWYDGLTNAIDEDLPPYQYWAFNVNSLFFGGGSPAGYMAYYSIGRTVSPSDWSDYKRLNRRIPGGYNGLQIMSTTKYYSGGNFSNTLYTPYYFYLPFPYFIYNETDYFKGSGTAAKLYKVRWPGTTSGTTGQDVNQPPANNTTTDASSATRYGLYITAYGDKWQRFLRDGLGLYNCTNSWDEFTSKPTAQWASVPVNPGDPWNGGITPGPPEDDRPGTGGQPEPSVPAGGGGNHDAYTSDPITPATTQTGGGRITEQWNMTGNEVKALQECLINDDLWNSFRTFFKQEPSEGVINLLQFPFSVTNLYTSGTEETVNILGTSMDFSGISYPCNGYKVPRDATTVIDYASFDIKEIFGSFLDYSATSFDLYLPFCGHVKLEPYAIQNHRLKIRYNVDLSDGSCLATCWVSNYRAGNWSQIESEGFYPLLSATGQIGTIIPLQSSDGLKKTQQKIQAASGLALAVGATIATGGAAAPAAAGAAGAAGAGAASSFSSMAAVGMGIGAANSAANIAMNKPSFQCGGVVDGNDTFSVSCDAILTRTFPAVVIPDGYNSIAGVPTNLYKKLKDVEGFTACDMVRTEGVGCTATEAEMIKSLLEQGVIV